VFVASTGVIGEAMPHKKLMVALPALHTSLRVDPWEAAARGIMAPDACPKASTHRVRVGKTEVRITDIAKDSGKIAPDIATMFCVVCTEANIPAVLARALRQRSI